MSQVSRVAQDRVKLASSLDSTRRQLGSAQHGVRERDEQLRRMRHAHAEKDEHPGLLQDLQILQLKLYGNQGFGGGPSLRAIGGLPRG